MGKVARLIRFGLLTVILLSLVSSCKQRRAVAPCAPAVVAFGSAHCEK